jgi:hypothetical protein
MIYQRKPGQTVCNIKESSGRSCHGSLKTYLPFAADYGELDPAMRQEIATRFGKRPELILYKCNFCKTVYTDV